MHPLSHAIDMVHLVIIRVLKHRFWLIGVTKRINLETLSTNILINIISGELSHDLLV